MTDEQDESGQGREKPAPRDAGNLEAGAGFLPPLEVAIDVPPFRYQKLSRIVAEHVVPRLVALLGQTPAAAARQPLTAEIRDLAGLVLGPENSDAADYLLKLKDEGLSLDDLHAELLEPAARLLGELWNEDDIDFVDVTLGVSRLQRLVHVFEGLDQVPDYDDKRRVLLAAAPGEQHSLGSTIVQKFLRAAGWHVWTCASPRIEEAADLVAAEWFAVVGFSVGSDIHVGQLSAAIAAVRQRSLNPKVGVMVGGSAITREPDLVARLGADGTAANGPAAVILAKKLLAASLV